MGCVGGGTVGVGLLWAAVLSLPHVAGAVQMIRVPVRVVESGVENLTGLSLQRPRWVLVLSGGSVRGVAHVGVLKALDEANLVPDGLVGSSMGALVGGLYAAGFRPEEIAARFAAVDWSGLIFDEPERASLPLARKAEHTRHLLMLRLGEHLSPVFPGAISPGQRLYQNLMAVAMDAPYYPETDWNRLRPPLRIQTTDLVTGASVPLGGGDLVLGLRGSLAMPLLFDPMPWDTLQLIDGGITANIPVGLAREMGAEVVVAVDCTARLTPARTRYEPWEIVDLVTTILEKAPNEQSLRGAEVVITPQFPEVSFAQAWRSGTLVQAGYEAAREALPRLRELLKVSALPDDTLRLPVVRVESAGEGVEEAVLEVVSGSAPSLGEIRRVLADLLTRPDVRDAWAEYTWEDSVLKVRAVGFRRLEGVALGGDRVLPDSVLGEPFRKHLGKPFTPSAARQSLEELLRLYRRQGYPAARVREAGFDTTSGVLTLALDVGRLGGVEFLGLERLSPSYLASESALDEGRPITREGLLKSTANWYATGLFRSVYPVLAPGEGGWWLKVQVSEQPGLPLRVGLAYQDEQLARGFAELVLPNPNYYANRMVLYSDLGVYDRDHRWEVVTDKLFGQPVTTSAAVGFSSRYRTEYVGHRGVGRYREERFGVRAEVGGQAPGWGLLAATLRWERHDNGYSDRREVYRLSALGGRLSVDTRDRQPFPRRGLAGDVQSEVAGRFWGSQRQFVRATGSGEVWASPRRRIALGIRVRAGTAEQTAPRDEGFRMGGMDSFPGLHLDEVWGRRVMAFGAEVRYDLVSRFLADSYLGVRYDVGGVWSDPRSPVRRRDWMPSAAVYAALDTFLGPVRIQYGRMFSGGGLSAQGVVSVFVGNAF